MLEKIWSKRLDLLVVAALVGLLAVVRICEDMLFYDPFAHYFRGEYLNRPIPHFHTLHLFLGLGTRYWVNSGISLCMIFILFRDRQQVQFAAVLYLAFFILLIISFLCLINFSGSENNFILFYVRRFLVQPIFVLLFIPAFYYQRMIKNNIL